MNVFQKIDESLFLLLNGNHKSVLDFLMLAINNFSSFIFVLLACIYVSVKYLRKEEGHRYTLLNNFLLVSLLVMQFLLAYYLLGGIFKDLFYRDRPCMNPNISSFVRMLGATCNPNNHSPFSAKPCLMFCLTSFLFFTIKSGFRSFKFTLILWSLLVAYSRIYLGRHYPLSVATSAAVGLALGFLINKLYSYLKNDLLVI